MPQQKGYFPQAVLIAPLKVVSGTRQDDVLSLCSGAVGIEVVRTVGSTTSTKSVTLTSSRSIRTSPNSTPEVQTSAFSRILRSVTHRSTVGSSREVQVAGIPMCRRCTWLTVGLLAGSIFGLLSHPTLAILVFTIPGIADLIREKFLRRPHLPMFLAGTSVGIGFAMGVFGAAFFTRWPIGVLLASTALMAFGRLLRIKIRAEQVEL